MACLYDISFLLYCMLGKGGVGSRRLFRMPKPCIEFVFIIALAHDSLSLYSTYGVEFIMDVLQESFIPCAVDIFAYAIRCDAQVLGRSLRKWRKTRYSNNRIDGHVLKAATTIISSTSFFSPLVSYVRSLPFSATQVLRSEVSVKA